MQAVCGGGGSAASNQYFDTRSLNSGLDFLNLLFRELFHPQRLQPGVDSLEL